MTSEVLIQLVMSLGVIPALFIWLVIDVRKEHKADKAESRKREDDLMAHIKKSDETQAAIMKSIEKISDNMGVIQKDVEILKEGR